MATHGDAYIFPLTDAFIVTHAYFIIIAFTGAFLIPIADAYFILIAFTGAFIIPIAYAYFLILTITDSYTIPFEVAYFIVITFTEPNNIIITSIVVGSVTADETLAKCFGHCFRLGVNAKLAVDALEVISHRHFADEQRLRAI